MALVSVSAQVEVETCESVIDFSAHGHMDEMKNCNQSLLIKTVSTEMITTDGLFVTTGGVRIVSAKG